MRILGILAILAACGQQAADRPPAGDGDSGGDESGAPDAGSPGAPDGGGGGGGGDDRAVLVRPGPTDNAELVLRLPVARSESGATRRVVMRLAPDDLPDLASGDWLSAPAEVQVTTRCDVGQTAPGCGYNPNVAARIILAGDPADTSADGPGSVALSDRMDLSCTAAEHHCRFTVTPGAAGGVLEDGADLPCIARGDCHVNLVMWAWHPDARAGGVDEVLVGENEGDFLANGIIKGDKGRLMAIRERGLGAGDRGERETSGSGTLAVPTTATPVVLYSHPLKAGGEGLAKDEQYVVEAKVVTAVSDRARFSTRMFLTHDPGARDGKLEKVAPESIGEHNGFNCTSGTSPCTTRKVSVFRVVEDIAGPVYVNIVGISEVPGPGSASVSVRRADGFVRSTRYAPSLKN
ncbi:MAG TPA: hypothetical protein VFU21_29960 [Kofleriaceae bacterium]|nr:hypothetical protein [Kofleriaceae bacterium]